MAPVHRCHKIIPGVCSAGELVQYSLVGRASWQAGTIPAGRDSPAPNELALYQLAGRDPALVLNLHWHTCGYIPATGTQVPISNGHCGCGYGCRCHQCMVFVRGYPYLWRVPGCKVTSLADIFEVYYNMVHISLDFLTSKWDWVLIPTWRIFVRNS
jgi:hypothetical protein